MAWYQGGTLVTFLDTNTPDAHGAGLTVRQLEPLRYDGHTDDPCEVAGKLRQLMPERVYVLDVGCGTGSVTAIVNRDKSNRVKAIEPDSDRAAVAKSRGIDTACTILDKNFINHNGPFDVIMFADVLEHLASPADILKLAIGGLKTGGLILVSVPNAAHWSLRLKLLFGHFDYTETGLCDSTHLRWFTQRTIEQLLRTHGLEIVDIQYTAGLSLEVYRSRYFRVIPYRILRKTVHILTRYLPRLLACQFVLKARMVAA
jgi:2-polyprenyl-3-methyl-5-hydroxy-6-metoxy-1,4-benzoquinol methylase